MLRCYLTFLLLANFLHTLDRGFPIILSTYSLVAGKIESCRLFHYLEIFQDFLWVF